MTDKMWDAFIGAAKEETAAIAASGEIRTFADYERLRQGLDDIMEPFESRKAEAMFKGYDWSDEKQVRIGIKNAVRSAAQEYLLQVYSEMDSLAERGLCEVIDELGSSVSGALRETERKHQLIFNQGDEFSKRLGRACEVRYKDLLDYFEREIPSSGARDSADRKDLSEVGHAASEFTALYSASPFLFRCARAKALKARAESALLIPVSSYRSFAAEGGAYPPAGKGR